MTIGSKRLLFAILVLLAGVNAALAALLPGPFVLQQAERQWEDTKSLVVDREVVREDVAQPSMERVRWRGGRIRVDGRNGPWVYSLGQPMSPSDHRPGIIDAIFLAPQGQLERVARSLDIALDHSTLDRVPRSSGPLPFDVIYRIGQPARRAAPHIEITKDSWTIRAIQFQEPSGRHIWRAEYDGHGRSSLLPPWLPSRTMVFRDGILFESIRVLRQVELPVPASIFQVSPPPQKSPVDVP